MREACSAEIRLAVDALSAFEGHHRHEHLRAREMVAVGVGFTRRALGTGSAPAQNCGSFPEVPAWDASPETPSASFLPSSLLSPLYSVPCPPVVPALFRIPNHRDIHTDHQGRLVSVPSHPGRDIPGPDPQYRPGPNAPTDTVPGSSLCLHPSWNSGTVHPAASIPARPALPPFE